MYDDDNDDNNGTVAPRLSAFDCVECSANNPVDDGFTSGDEVTCFYCGCSFAVSFVNGKLKFKTV